VNNKTAFQNLKTLVESIIVNRMEANVTIRIRGSSFQVDFVHGGKRYRKNLPTRADAENYEITAKARLIKGLPPDQEQEQAEQQKSKWRCLDVYLWTVYEQRWSKQKSWKTTKNRINKMLHELDGSMYIDDITTDVLDKYVVQLERNGNRPGTINRKLSILSAALKHAYRREELQRMPHIPRQGEPPTRFRWYSEEEQRLILTAANDVSPEFFLLIMTLFDTGMRISEALMLSDMHVMLDSRVFVLSSAETKNSSSRSIPMTDRLHHLYSQRQPHTGKYFSISYDQVCKDWSSVRDRIGMGTGDTIHAMRHTFCSRLSQNGVDMRRIQELAGHKDLATTQRYTHLDAKRLSSDIGKLEACTDLQDLIPCDTRRDTVEDLTSN